MAPLSSTPTPHNMPLGGPHHRPRNHIHTITNPSGTASFPCHPSVPAELVSGDPGPSVFPSRSRPRVVSHHRATDDASIASTLLGVWSTPTGLATTAARRRDRPRQDFALAHNVIQPGHTVQGTTVIVKRDRIEGGAELPTLKRRDRPCNHTPRATSALGAQPIGFGPHIEQEGETTRFVSKRGEASGTGRTAERSSKSTKLKRPVNTASLRKPDESPSPVKGKQRSLAVSGSLGARPGRQVTAPFRRSGGARLMIDLHTNRFRNQCGYIYLLCDCTADFDDPKVPQKHFGQRYDRLPLNLGYRLPSLLVARVRSQRMVRANVPCLHSFANAAPQFLVDRRGTGIGLTEEFKVVRLPSLPYISSPRLRSQHPADA